MNEKDATKLKKLSDALAALRGAGVEPWDLLAFAMASIPESVLAEEKKELEIGEGEKWTAMDSLDVELDAELDDPSMGENLLRDAMALRKLIDEQGEQA